MTTQNFTIPLGNTWNPSIAITEDDVAKNCANLTCKLILKKGVVETLDALFTLSISWLSQAGGTGSFTLTNAQSKTLSALSSYPYWVKLYLADGSFYKDIANGSLFITESSDKDLPT